ncbi:unnamed protein product [Linum trigynum]|uniref:Uncharacterized protein n=1 Tax=Linum trigynum TaxID=586398 RepID=A0AAV2DAE8_9ROSI
MDHRRNDKALLLNCDKTEGVSTRKNSHPWIIAGKHFHCLPPTSLASNKLGGVFFLLSAASCSGTAAAGQLAYSSSFHRRLSSNNERADGGSRGGGAVA